MKKLLSISLLFALSIISNSVMAMNSRQSFDQWQNQRRAEEARRADNAIQQAKTSNRPISPNVYHHASPAYQTQAHAHNNQVNSQRK